MLGIFIPFLCTPPHNSQCHFFVPFPSNVLGIFIPFLCTPPHNSQCCFFLPQNDFRKEGEESSNLVVMHRTYHFLHTLADSLLAFILTRCGRSTNIILLRQDGGVFQSGAVQTMVRKQMKGNGEIILKWLGVSMCHACIDLLDPCSVLYWCVMLQFCIKVSWQCFVLMFCAHSF